MGKIVIVDDDKSVIDTLKIILSDLSDLEGFQETKAAKKYIEKNPEVSLLILDYRIGASNGIDFYKQEIIPNFGKIPAILISAIKGQRENSQKELEEIKELFIKCLEKPFDAFELKNFVSKFLNH